MITPAERRALLFLSGLLVLGAAVRARAVLVGGPPRAAAAEERALARQIAKVDSVRRAKSRARPRPESRRPRIPRGSGVAQLGDTVEAQRGPVLAGVVMAAPTVIAPPAARGIDLDRASAAEIEQLPRIGPALAQRIVADRDSLGPFGSLEALRRVRGVGPAIIRAIAPYVTFSLPPRPSRVDDRAGGASGRTRHGRSRRARAPSSLGSR